MDRSVTFVLGLLTLGWTTCAAGDEPSAAYEHLKPMEWQVGDWVAEYESTSDSGPIKKGDTVTTRFSVRWSPDRSFFVNDSVAEVNGKRVAASMEIISWNHATSKVSHAYFGTWGTGQGVWTKVGDAAELEWTIQGSYGKFAGTAYVKKGADSWDWQIRKQTHDGAELPDMPVTTFKRRVGAPAGDLWQAYQKAAAGTWVGEGQLLWDIPRYQVSKSEPFTAKLSLQEESRGSVLSGGLDFQTTTKPVKLQAFIVIGWDPDSQQVCLRAHWNNGFIEEILLSRRDGDTFFGTYGSKVPGGPADTWPISMQFPTVDAFEYKFVGGPFAGKVLSSWKREMQ